LGAGCQAIAFALVLSACQSSISEQPNLSDEKLARLMADLSVADAATTGMVGFSKDSLVQVYFKQVLDLHGVTLESYERDLRIVSNDLDHLDRVLKRAEEMLTVENKEAAPSPPTPKQ
jgi:hypothetical protein